MPQKRFEFVVLGVPHSVNSKNKKARSEWMNKVRATAEKQWSYDKLSDPLNESCTAQVHIAMYFTAQQKDADNIIKPIIDALRIPDEFLRLERIAKQRRRLLTSRPFCVFESDGIVESVTSRRFDLNVYTKIDEPSPMLAAALFGDQTEFVQVSVEWNED